MSHSRFLHLLRLLSHYARPYRCHCCSVCLRFVVRSPRRQLRSRRDICRLKFLYQLPLRRNCRPHSRPCSVRRSTFGQRCCHGLTGLHSYVNEATARNQNLTYASGDSFVLRTDSRSVLSAGGPGRNSVRLKSRRQWNTHVTVIDLRHLPQACGQVKQLPVLTRHSRRLTFLQQHMASYLGVWPELALRGRD